MDKDFRSFKVIKENINSLNIEEYSEVYKLDYKKALEYFQENHYKFDYVFLDPPYNLHKINDILKTLVDYDLLNNDALVICESLKEVELIENYLNLKFKKEYLYGISKITIYQKCGEVNE